jgi:hypothetical protein
VTTEDFLEDPEPQPISLASDENLVEVLSGEVIRIIKKLAYDAICRDL